MANWEKDHQKLLEEIAPEAFEVLHYVAMTVLNIKVEMKNGLFFGGRGKGA